MANNMHVTYMKKFHNACWSQQKTCSHCASAWATPPHRNHRGRWQQPCDHYHRLRRGKRYHPANVVIKFTQIIFEHICLQTGKFVFSLHTKYTKKHWCVKHTCEACVPTSLVSISSCLPPCSQRYCTTSKCPFSDATNRQEAPSCIKNIFQQIRVSMLGTKTSRYWNEPST